MPSIVDFACLLPCLRPRSLLRALLLYQFSASWIRCRSLAPYFGNAGPRERGIVCAPDRLSLPLEPVFAIRARTV